MNSMIFSSKIFLVIAMMGHLSSCSSQNELPEEESGTKQESVGFDTKEQTTTMNLHQFSAIDINGKTFDFSKLKGKKVIIVNTASECGYTYQYKGLQDLYSNMGGDKLEIIGFPCNDFGAQEPGTEAEIAGFCEKNYGVTFPMMSKITVKGETTHPVFQWLVNAENNGVADFPVNWNFQKYLINEDGSLETCYDSKVEPTDERILSWLGK